MSAHVSSILAPFAAAFVAALAVLHLKIRHERGLLRTRRVPVVSQTHRRVPVKAARWPRS